MSHLHIPPLCQLEDAVMGRPQNDKTENCYLPIQFCETHQVLVCHCGWEFGWHGGTESKPSTIPFRKYWYHNINLREKIELTWKKLYDYNPYMR